MGFPSVKVTSLYPDEEITINHFIYNTGFTLLEDSFFFKFLDQFTQCNMSDLRLSLTLSQPRPQPHLPQPIVVFLTRFLEIRVRSHLMTTMCFSCCHVRTVSLMKMQPISDYMLTTSKILCRCRPVRTGHK